MMNEPESMPEMHEQGAVELVGEIVGTATMTATARLRVNMSVQNMLAAGRFSQAVRDVENMHKGELFGPFWEEILHNATACIFCCVAGLESYANEMFADRGDLFPAETCSVKSPELLKDLWATFDKRNLQEKFDFLQLVQGRGRLDVGQGHGQRLLDLVQLRNSLIHFKPEWDDEDKGHHKLSKRLATYFLPSSFLNDENVFPRRWATHGCTRWAVNTTVGFVNAFEHAMGWEARYDLRKPTLLDP